MKKTNNKGITLIALVITIIIMMILVSIGICYLVKVISKENVENIRTNMLLINAKAKEYCEEANFKLGTGSVPENEDELNTYMEPGIKYLENKKEIVEEQEEADEQENVNEQEEADKQENLNEKEDENRPAFTRIYEYQNITNADDKQFVVQLDSNIAQIMGLKGVNDPEKYLILFDIIKNEVEIFYIEGIEGEIDGNEGTYYSLTDIEKI